jgi:hypothetical protein
MKTRSEKQV